MLGHLASYGRDDALVLLRRYAATGANWAWALDELALRDDDTGLRSLAEAVLARFPATPEGTAELAATVRDAFEPAPGGSGPTTRVTRSAPVSGPRRSRAPSTGGSGR